MFRGGATGMPPGAPMLAPPPQQSLPQPLPPMPCELSAREKLSSYVYEYLLQSGATKTAESFKEEVLGGQASSLLTPPQQQQQQQTPNPMKTGEKGSFLLDWWLLFWDLWSAAPERREHADQFSPDAKYFIDNMIPMPPMMNGGHFGPPMGMDMMGGHPGAFGRFAPPPGRMGPAGMAPAGFHMFAPDPRMQRIPPPPGPGQQLRMGPPQAFPGGPPGEMPGMRYDFMPPPPGQFASSGGMMPNGGMMSLNSPNMGPPPVGDPGSMPGAFMGMPAASSAGLSFGMSTEQPMSAGPPVGPGGPGTPGMGGAVQNPGSIPQATSVGSVGTPGSQVPKTEPAANGDDVKMEALTPTGGAGSVQMNGGSGSAPGSAHSANNNVNPGTPGNPLSNPLSNPMSNPPLSTGPPPASADTFKDDNAITKIRDSLLDGFKNETTEEWGDKSLQFS
ncbi:unnamed protein product [Caenorhabditis sp. 36 PRJEB53466]|nr:unnamed protein product [Caenorhabditis sp. 36 PRJEB53466]